MKLPQLSLTFITVLSLHFAQTLCIRVWGDWSQFGECTRYCGGGIQSRIRPCLYEISDKNQKQRCTAPTTETQYRSCNMQECPPGTRDFRAEQCHEFSGIPVDGIIHEWKPFYGGDNKCELLCMAVNETFYQRLMEKVIDGTPCDQLSNDICIDGICQKAGCDHVLGSNVQYDKCRVCGGDGTSCVPVQGRFDEHLLKSGYNEVIKLPAGSTSIQVMESQPSSNYIVLKSNSGTFILNGNLQLGKSIVIEMVGTYLEYSQDPYGVNYTKRFVGNGPINETLYVYVMSKDSKNPGIQYTYFVPRDSSKNLEIAEYRDYKNGVNVQALKQTVPETRATLNVEPYFWSYGSWTSCSVDCGEGTRRRAVSCMDRTSRGVVSPDLCDPRRRPQSKEACRGDQCGTKPSTDISVQWQPQEWGPCSATCDGGEQDQSVVCFAMETNQNSYQVDDSLCFKAYGNKPEFRRACNEEVPCPEWRTTDWSQCSNQCGEGTKSRQVYCSLSDSGHMPDQACSPSDQPSKTRRCIGNNCDSSRPDPETPQCANTLYGCCPDGRMAATGNNFEGCTPDCNRYPYGCCQDGKTPARGSGYQGCIGCTTYSYGCCPDGKTPARGPQNEGCTGCARYRYGCCQDGKTQASGPRYEGCTGCIRYQFGCCQDGKTPARGSGFAGCTGCATNQFGCCQDGKTQAKGPNFGGCTGCSSYQYGCCQDSQTEARGPQYAGCTGCASYQYGCCQDGQTQSRGPQYEGCSGCTRYQYGCCPDGETPARGPSYQGCSECSKYQYGCCQDGKTPARGSNFAGCTGCSSYQYGCCQDGQTQARGPNFEGCSDCSRYQYGCCQDGKTPARGPSFEGCSDCSKYQYGCCQDGKTPARGSDFAGCTGCSSYQYGCCQDGQTQARGPNFEGCSDCSRYQYGCCQDGKTPARGSDFAGCTGCSSYQYGCCQDGQTQARGPNFEGCSDCSRYQYGCCQDGKTPARGPSFEGCSDCSKYQYGCCQDGKTPARGPNFEGCSGCINSRFGCCSDGTRPARGPSGQGCSTDDVCRLDNVRGSCTDYSVKWYYDKEKAKCDRFWYGGCDGNLNRFDTEADCTTHCINGTTSGEVPVGCQNSRYGCCRDGVTAASGPQYQGCPSQKPTGPKCKQSKDSGTCQDYKVLWYYNTDKEICDRFWYGGCGGNDNRFSTEKDCIEACQQKEEIPTVATKTTTTTTTGVREEYKPGKCPPVNTASNATCRAECDSDYECSGHQKCCVNGCNRKCINPVKEPERANKQGKCPVVPAGTVGICVEECSNDYSCDGAQKCCSNGCGHTCQDPADETRPTEPEIGSVCALEQERGSCIDYSVLWYYNKGIGKCKRFWYGGCDGNGNRFATEDDCLAKCSRPIKPEDACTLPSVTGRCRASFKRWYFDARIQQCRTFIYGGCGGNSNRFNTRAECEKNCLRSAASTRITNFHTEKVTSNEIMLAWEPPQRNQVQNYKLEYMGVKYFRDSTKQEPLQEVVLSGKSTNYKMNNLMDAAEYTINLMPMFPGSNGPKESLVARTNPIETTVLCSNSGYGCCPDGVTSAEGPNNKGCADACQATDFGCCDDGETAATGPNQEGCDLGSGDDDNFCEQSVFGCCPDGTTPAQGANQEGCGIVVTSSTIGNKACGLKPERGRCTDYVVRWFYNSTEARCDRFWYGGCDGNQNKYETEAECTETCINSGITVKPPVTTPVCEQPKIVGPCRAALTRYYYNGRNCEMFLYGGCQGNQNNFETEEECGRRCSNAIDIDNVDETIDACLQPPEQGRCKARKLRWFFNKATGSCQQFVYGGCRGNNNRFYTKPECEQRCLSYTLTTQANKGKPIDTCSQSMDTGPCLEHHPRWYYDSSRRDCVEFDYGGCEGNDNNFVDRDSCLRKCGAGGIDKPLDKEDEDICRMTEKEGKQCDTGVDGSIQRWFYDYSDGVCKQFTFNGCDGNKNNFATQAECESYCSRDYVCKPFVYPPFQCLAYLRRFRYDPVKKDCTEFIYGGCGGNSNNFANLNSCLKKCAPEKLVVIPDPATAPPSSWKDICNMPAETGPCRASFVKYYHNKDTLKCEQFTYGGCGGNQNQFETKEQCQQYCGESETIVDSGGSGEIDDAYCRLPKELGNCLYSIPAWYYDYTTGTCQQFIYSGCGGNENRFTSKDTCEISCKSDSATTVMATTKMTTTTPTTTTSSSISSDKAVCYLPLAEGNCKKYTARYYYDMSIKDCKPFWYTGCDGNANNFETGQQCRDRCWSGDNVIPPVYTPAPPKTTQTTVVITNFDVCNERSDRGSCTDYAVKWYFDTEEQRCKRFWYGGCDGNANNFNNETECQETCVYRVRPQPGTTQTPVRDCRLSRYGCCPDNRTPAVDRYFSNCIRTTQSPVRDCRRSAYGCCPDNKTPAVDRYFSNCNIKTDGEGSDTLVNGEYTNIVEQPGRAVTIDCLAYKSRNYEGTVSWYRDGFLVTQGSKYTITTDGALIITTSTSEDSGIYACRISSNNASPYIERYRLQIEEPVGIYPTPSKIIVRPGGTAFLHCQAYGKPKPTVTWSRSRQSLPRDPRYVVHSNGTLIISGAMEDDVGDYLCVADNRVSSPSQRSVTLELRDTLRAKIDPINGRLREGERLYLHCNGYGFPVPTIEWEKSGRPLSSDQRVSVISGNLRVANVALEDTGLYTCIVSNDEEKVEASVSVQVIPQDVKPDNCVDKASSVKCRLIVRARLCGYSIYSKQCCNSCEQEKRRLLGRQK